MKKAITIVTLTLVFTFASLAQDKFTVAYNLVNNTQLSENQQTYLFDVLKGKQPSKADKLFTDKEYKNIFTNRVEQNADYKAYSALTKMSEKKAQFRYETPEVKAVLWKTHFITALATLDLTRQQQVFLYKFAKLVSPEVYIADTDSESFKNSELGRRMQTLMQDAQSLFGEELGYKIFVNLGLNEQEKVSCASPKTKFTQFIQKINYTGSSGACTCNGNIADCGWCYNLCKGTGCMRTADGCGVFWASSCTNTCSSCCGSSECIEDGGES